MKILVTGGAGFLGNNLVHRLLKEGHDVVVFDNGFRVGFVNLENITVEHILGDISDPSDWKKLPTDFDQVFHLAAINGTKYFYEIPEKILDINVGGTLNLMKWISHSSTKKVFFTTGLAVLTISTC